MQSISLILILTLFLSTKQNIFFNIPELEEESCNLTYAAEQFKKKVLVTPTPSYDENPYYNQTTESKKELAAYLENHEIVCGLKYLDSQKINYTLKTFTNATDCNNQGYIVTHQGRCGSCSTLQDLAVYLAVNLTDPARRCAVLQYLDKKWDIDCLQKVGMTDNCATIWMYDSKNTGEKCGEICLKDWILKTPDIVNGKLNPCLECDETKSGPLFKYFAGRTRRDSGIVSSIPRPSSQVYNMTQCYY